VATKNSRQPIYLVRYINALRALPSILRHSRPALKTINLAKEMRNSGVFAMLLQDASQQLPDIVWPPRKRATTTNFASIILLANN